MSENSESSLWDSFRPKVKIIGSFAKHCKDHQRERAELLKFVEKMVEELLIKSIIVTTEVLVINLNKLLTIP
jgi:NADPH:quinone reductase-like Zn-dependent oxidoreductase